MTIKIGSRAIIGEFYLRLAQYLGSSWITRVARQFGSDQESETYNWLGQSPAMREWIGGRQAKGLRENGITIVNKEFEATMEIPTKWIRRDKTGQIMIRIAELAQRTGSHWAKLLSTIIANGTGSTNGNCYDGQYFFDSDHSEGDSGTQKNLLTNTEVPALDVTSATAPTPTEAVKAILGVIGYMLGYKDDQAEPMNADAREFLVMTSPALWTYLAPAIVNDTVNAEDNTIKALAKEGFRVSIAANPRLTYTTQFATFRTDAPASALIRQEEVPIEVDAQAEGSHEEFHNKRHLYGVQATRNVGYGYWQYAAHSTLS